MAYLAGYSKYKVLTLTGGASGALSDHQLKIIVSYEAAMDGEFDDIRFTQADGTTLVDAWAEVIVTDTSATIWVEFPSTPANTVEQIYRMYYGNSGAASDWDGAATFIQWHGTASSTFLDALSTPAICVYEAKIKGSTSNFYARWGLENVIDRSDDEMMITVHDLNGFNYIAARNEGTQSYVQEAWSHSTGTWYKLLIQNDGSTVRGYFDSNEISTGVTTNLPNETMGLWMATDVGSVEQDWSFSRKYAANPPTYAFGAEQSVPTGIMPVLSHLYNQMRQ